MGCYAAYGLVFESADRVRTATAFAGAAPQDVVHLRLGNVPPDLRDPVGEGEMAQVNEREFLFDLAGVVRALATEGERLELDFAEGAGADRGWYSALTMGAAMIGMQRGLFPLHGSAVLTRAGAAAFVGESGAGKSTLVAALTAAGYGLVTDDLCLIRAEERDCRIGSGIPSVRLLPDAARRLAVSGDEVEKSKIRVSLPLDCHDAPLRRVYDLDFGEPGSDAKIRRLSHLEGLSLITRGMRLTIGLDRLPPGWQQRNFALVADLARRLEFYAFTRPKDYSTFETSMRILTEHLESPRS